MSNLNFKCLSFHTYKKRPYMHQNNSNNIYSPSMKLWEGNVFADVCLSVHSGGGGGPNVTMEY